MMTAWLTLGAIYAGNLIFCEYLLHKKLNASKLEAAALACVISSMMIQWMPSGVQGIYWYNGAMNYTFFFGVMLVFMSMLIGLHSHRVIWKNCLYVCATALLGVVLVGGNHVTAFMGIIFTIGICVTAIIQKNKQFIVGSIFTLASMLVGFGINITSPGTAIRQAAIGEHKGAVETIWQSVLWGMHYIDEWIGIEICVGMSLMFPLIILIVKKVQEKYKFQFRYPLLVLIGSVAWICMMFCPVLYATGGNGEGRLQNVVYFSFVILIFANEFYLCGWIDIKVGKENAAGDWAKSVCVSKAGMATAFVLLIGLYLSVGSAANASIARNSMKNGEAQLYSEIMYERYDVLRDSKGQDVRVDGIWVQPQLLYFSDISVDANIWPNTSVCDYFDLNSVAIN